jgi:hypothetical protein
VFGHIGLHGIITSNPLKKSVRMDLLPAAVSIADKDYLAGSASNINQSRADGLRFCGRMNCAFP